MDVKLLWLTVVLLSSPLLTLCQPLFVLSAPNLLRVGSSENVFVEAHNYTEREILNVRISVMNFPKKNVEMLSKAVTLNATNNYQILTDIKIPDDQNFFSDDPLEKQYVFLQARFPSRTLEKVVMVSFQSGYIFVQTDKPIYTPASTVQYRIFSLTPNMKPLSQTEVTVEIKNPQDITLLSESFTVKEAMKSGKYPIPEVASTGIWKVVTRYKKTPQKMFTAEFEVKEYVLPSFEVRLKPSKAFYHVADKSLKVDIEAKYLFGKNVEGNAFVVFGVMDGEKKTSIPASLQRVQINEGEGTAELTREMITKTYPDIIELVGRSIYVSVSLLTESGSEMVEAERRGIQIVTSPYTIHFTKTPQFFKPGMPFTVSVYITNPDQTPVESVEVEVNPGAVRGQTGANGIVKLTVNTAEESSTLEITAKTKDPKISNDQQAEKKMSAQAYVSKGEQKNYLHIGIDAAELKIGDQMTVNLNTEKSPKAKNQDLTYMILNKGQIIHAERFKWRGQSLVTLSLPVTKDMVPSFRFVAYYHVSSSEVVSDSVWVDVKDTCMGTLKLQVRSKMNTHAPRDKVKLQITGDPGARVGLVAVDKAVHVLNKNRLTQTKIWDAIEKHDIGCTAGGGRDSMGVFSDAGLMFESSTAGGTNTRTDPKCPVPAKRKRRAESLVQITGTLAGKYSDELKQCCIDGMRDNKLGYTCERRATYIIDGPKCAEAFLLCCNEMKTRKNTKTEEEELILARSVEDDDYYTDSDDIVTRTEFPESWLWEDIELCENCPAPVLDKFIYLKDSITTWQILAVSLSPTLGICVAEPVEIVVFKPFFIDLKMPYSAVRGEQLEIKAIIHNYTPSDLDKVYVEFMKTEGVCSSASKKGKYRKTVKVGEDSSIAVSYVIVPMTLGDHHIEVKAATNIHTDAVRKTLKVVSEGVRKELHNNVELNPAKEGEKPIILRGEIPADRMPDTPANTFIRVTGKDISQVVEQSISGDIMGRLIVKPGGCGEQNMIRMTLPVIATHYLDSTNQWEAVGIDRRSEAINHIDTGYQGQLSYRKDDGSYAIWKQTPSSTWLTAYVAKVFSMANNLIAIEENVLCSTLKWLVLYKQLPDGSFKEDSAVHQSEMTGGVEGKDADASLTAFVVIAMQEGREICAGAVNSLDESIRKAVEFLEGRLLKLINPYAVALTSYAMANAGKLNKETLLRHSKQERGDRFWTVPEQRYHSREATAYAVLALVKAKDFDIAGEAVRWLSRQQSHYGGSGTTQATIMVFQALAEYHMQVKDQQVFNLDVELSVAGRSKPVRWTIVRKNEHVTRSDRVEINKDFSVTARGTGTATLSVLKVYYARPAEKKSDCTFFNLSVKMEKDPETEQEDNPSYNFIMDFLFKNNKTDATMTILDIGIPTGFDVEENDLEKLSSGKERYIQKYEKNTELSERGSLILYLQKVSHKETERIAFRMKKIVNVGLLQPAAVTIYEYYSPDARCTKFYHPERSDGALYRLCEGDVCLCAEENCTYQMKNNIKEDDRMNKACETGMDYVYKVTVVGMDLALDTDVYNVKVDQVLKQGTDEDVEGRVISFLARPSCREHLELVENKLYLIMGKSTDLSKPGDSLQYIFGEETWIEYWPTREESQTPQYRDQYIGISALENSLLRYGCPA
ncbi:complement C3-like [Chanodichthys erythropterus]|uniref:complement C3-like n=1 Tax=Chanodichthys erythropterus TaxID=933992 RepID=UPI00351E5C78